jgi:hypothetical protein
VLTRSEGSTIMLQHWRYPWVISSCMYRTYDDDESSGRTDVGVRSRNYLLAERFNGEVKKFSSRGEEFILP